MRHLVLSSLLRLWRESGDTSIIQNVASAFGISQEECEKFLQEALQEVMENYSQEEQEEITGILGSG